MADGDLNIGGFVSRPEHRVIWVLESRRTFRHWWNSLPEEDQDGLRASIAKAIAQTDAPPAGTVTITPGGLEAEKDPDEYPHRICNNDLNGHVAHFYTTKFSDHGPSYEYYCPGLNFGPAEEDPWRA